MSIISHIKESKAELAHVKWPTKKQVINYTILIIVISLFLAAYVGVLDVIFSKILGWILSTRG